MLDINFIRENLEVVKFGAKKKHIQIDLDKLVDVDDKRREILGKFEEKKAEQNKISKEIGQASPEEREKLIAGVGALKEEVQKLENELKEVMKEWKTLMMKVPNIPDISVPEGASDEDNVEVKVWGEKPNFDFQPKSHTDLMLELDLVDFERGSKVHGFRGYYLKNDAVRLNFAIWQYALDFWTQKKGFTPMIVPAIVKEEIMYGTGYLPNEADDIYRTQDDDYLTGTAEVATMAYYSGEVVDVKDPIKFLAFSPPFRREAGSYGKDTKGLIRVHEFYKWEQVLLCEASHELSEKLHEEITQNTEEFIESLEIPYHRVVNCGGDLGQGQVKKYDIELWVPGENKYREIASASYFHDFQTRRLGIKYKDENGKLKFAHSLNNTAIPTPRILVSLIENFQTSDGKIKIPEVLRKYMGGQEFIG